MRRSTTAGLYGTAAPPVVDAPGAVVELAGAADCAGVLCAGPEPAPLSVDCPAGGAGGVALVVWGAGEELAVGVDWPLAAPGPAGEARVLEVGPAVPDAALADVVVTAALACKLDRKPGAFGA